MDASHPDAHAGALASHAAAHSRPDSLPNSPADAADAATADATAANENPAEHGCGRGAAALQTLDMGQLECLPRYLWWRGSAACAAESSASRVADLVPVPTGPPVRNQALSPERCAERRRAAAG